MDIDRTSLPDRNQEPQQRAARAQPAQGKSSTKGAGQPDPTAPLDAASQPVAPEYGGALAASRTDKEGGADPDPSTEERRQKAYDSIAKFLKLPGKTELDIQVDTQDEQITFQIRDRDTGELIREVPEGDADSLVEKLREFTGTLVDRRF
ncbi:MAG: flagellar protein FlaG [Planctomycetota bacterium]